MELARRLDGVEIVSIDSMQVYRGMDIGTAKPTTEERAAVPHHLLDLADPSEDYSVARFQAEARTVLAGIEMRGNRALLVGGTGLYLNAVVDGLTLPGEWPALRSQLEEEAGTPAGVGALYRRLADADPDAAARIQPANRRRIVRALEVTLGSGRRFSSFGPGLDAYPPTSVRIFGVRIPRDVLADRIEARLQAQLEAGFLEEVKTLAARPQGLSRTAQQALGYRELLDHLGGWVTLAQATVSIVTRTRQLARRQRAWFRRDPRITWLEADGNPVDLLPHLLRDLG